LLSLLLLLFALADREGVPMATMTSDDDINSDGYIAGVCNPAFADRPSWWDVLCNIETGKIVVSKDLRSPPSSFASNTLTAGGTLGAGSRNTLGRADAAQWAANGGVDEFGAQTGGGGGGGGKEGKEGKGESSDQVFMEEVRRFPFFVRPFFLAGAAG
jgi:hypothetical protein